MENIMMIIGNVKFSITLDPGVWIFDDRRVDLDTYFDEFKTDSDALEEYTKSISTHWDREIMEGSTFPKTLKTEKKFEKEKVLSGSFGIPFKPFLKNAEPHEQAKEIEISQADGVVVIPIEEAEHLILGFSKNGKPLVEDGPVHVYYQDGSNRSNPLKRVKAFRVL
ncbi:peptidyl-prolyl cis-trans isomerase [Cytobacillus spongiae]|jgi:hypothetical protein|uniref:peptidyl-prolyl cis-trans isomerase n=1 Tax=Cytobacillus spongiae TaxID=2901381 RepID=UPI001F298EC0|nr:peptidyl-prolyl cis-trans isomerase [Cytobacillus spongiae]UII57269.1 peptidyl-prolyl cis-trans isomerase [Cytobacillus spongiae]